MTRLAAIFCSICLALALALPASLVLDAPAAAQQAGQQQGGGLLRFLFGRNEQPQRMTEPQRAQPREQRPRTQRRASPSGGGGSAATAAPAPVAVDKADDAKRILVIGDFLAGGLAEGLTTAYAEEAQLRVISRSNGSSGLVRDDYYDWPGQIGQILETDEPDAVVVMIGSNDRQQMLVRGSREQPRSDAWMKEYEARATAIAAAVAEHGVPLVWVGNLPFRSGAMSSDMVAFNDVYRRVAESVKGEFVDVWDGFVDEAGSFVASGPDMNGQPAQLRSDDGINVTRAGRRKIAFFVEKPLARLLGTDETPGLPSVGTGVPLPEADPAIIRDIDRTQPIALGEGDGGSATELLGNVVRPRDGEAHTPAEQLLRQGIAPDTRPGRADDFVVGRPAAAPAASREQDVRPPLERTSATPAPTGASGG